MRRRPVRYRARPSSAPVSSTGQALRAPSPRHAGRRERQRSRGLPIHPRPVPDQFAAAVDAHDGDDVAGVADGGQLGVAGLHQAAAAGAAGGDDLQGADHQFAAAGQGKGDFLHALGLPFGDSQFVAQVVVDLVAVHFHAGGGGVALVVALALAGADGGAVVFGGGVLGEHAGGWPHWAERRQAGGLDGGRSCGGAMACWLAGGWGWASSGATGLSASVTRVASTGEVTRVVTRGLRGLGRSVGFRVPVGGTGGLGVASVGSPRKSTLTRAPPALLLSGWDRVSLDECSRASRNSRCTSRLTREPMLRSCRLMWRSSLSSGLSDAARPRLGASLMWGGGRRGRGLHGGG